MGASLSNQKQILQKGQQIKKDLYQRVDMFRKNHQQELKIIDPKLKKHVITKSVLQLVRMLQDKQVTSEQLVLIFAQRAATIGVQNNYVFDQMFQQALMTARQYDDERKKHPQKKNWDGKPQTKSSSFPPFYGVPASYKQNIIIKGRTSHAGFIIPHQKNTNPEQHSLFVQLTVRMGLIPFVRSNVMQSCKTGETNNNMFGYAKNPWNEERSCGGSSGGEGGLIGSYCSPIGFGTDIGGSIRIPAEWNGLTALKPALRYSRRGNCYYGRMTDGSPIKSELGPISRSTQDIIMFMKFMCDQSNYVEISKTIMDPYLTLKPFSSKIFTSQPKLKIGYLPTLATLPCSPSHTRALQTCLQILKSQGHQLQQIHLPRLQELYFCFMQVYLADGSTKFIDEEGAGEGLVGEYKGLEELAGMGNWMKKWTAWWIRKKEPRMAKMLEYAKEIKVGEMFETFYNMYNEISNQIYQYLVANEIEAIVMPSFPLPAAKISQIGKLQYTFSYTASWNALSYPVGIVPVTVVQQSEQFYEDTYNDSTTQAIRQNIQGSKGLPVGVQVISLPLREQVLLYVMNILEKGVKFREKHQCQKALGYEIKQKGK